jgi:hypothetical protein
MTDPSTSSSTDAPAPAAAPTDQGGPAPTTRRAAAWRTLSRLTVAVRDADESQIEAAVRTLGSKRRYLAPLGYIAGGFGLLLDGVKLLFSNWRLTLIEILPAVWIWLTFWNLKSHYIRGRDFAYIHGWLALALAIVVVAITVGSYWCNAVFAFAVAGPKPPKIRPAVAQVREHLREILGWGFVVGMAHASATIYVSRWGTNPFTLAMGAVLVVMMVTFVSIPAQFIGAQTAKLSLQDKISGAAASGAMSAVLTSPGFILNRLGLLLAGTAVLRIPGVIVYTIGIALQAAATSGAKAVKLGTKWAAGVEPHDGEESVDAVDPADQVEPPEKVEPVE